MAVSISDFEYLSGFKKSSGGWQACCPAHDDGNASLSIGIGDDDKIILYCHAGCSVNDIVGKMGFSVSDLFPMEDGNQKSNSDYRSNSASSSQDEGQPCIPKAKIGNTQRRKIVATYDYNDANGVLVYQVVRYDPKDFRQRCPDGNGGWKWSTKGIRRVLYRLAEIRENSDARVIVVEGEKDADRLCSLGLTATTCAQGAGKWQASYSKTLARRDVVIIPDNDEPGRKHAEKVAISLHDNGCNVRIVQLPVGEKGDVSDFLDDGNTIVSLGELIDETDFFIPPGAKFDESESHVPLTKSQKIVSDLESLSYDLRLNTLEDNVEVGGRPIDDVILSEINLRMADHEHSRADTYDAINVLSARKRYHPIRDYLLSLKWDGASRLDNMFDCFKAEKGSARYVEMSSGKKGLLHHGLMMRWLLGCVVRGINNDENAAFTHQTPMLVIVGPQGIGKSSWPRWLASGVGFEFHRESPIDPHNNDDLRSFVVKWIWEASELAASLRRRDRDSLKSLITQERHTYRKPYGKFPITKPTLVNLIGTLNPETGFLDDPTGNRRFLPITISRIDHAYSDLDVNQVWAELVHMYKSGVSPDLSRGEYDALQDAYMDHRVDNPLETYLDTYFDIDPENTEIKMHTSEIIQRLQAFNVSLPQNVKVAGQQIGEVLAPLGLERKRFRMNHSNSWGWVGIAKNSILEP